MQVVVKRPSLQRLAWCYRPVVPRDKSLPLVHWIRWCVTACYQLRENATDHRERYKTVQDAAWLEEVQCRDKIAVRFFCCRLFFFVASLPEMLVHVDGVSLVDNPAVCKVLFFLQLSVQVVRPSWSCPKQESGQARQALCT